MTKTMKDIIARYENHTVSTELKIAIEAMQHALGLVQALETELAVTKAERDALLNGHGISIKIGDHIIPTVPLDTPAAKAPAREEWLVGVMSAPSTHDKTTILTAPAGKGPLANATDGLFKE